VHCVHKKISVQKKSGNFHGGWSALFPKAEFEQPADIFCFSSRMMVVVKRALLYTWYVLVSAMIRGKLACLFKDLLIVLE
jgi:hypothetical protein